ncbi:MAG: anthranilate phosphoribosyltransferase [Verrucomicrobia bacterium]|nr:anthranilate phosphoribosyltransferase [Verrucomicrobiota bacterium]
MPQSGTFLCALHRKGETVDEVVGIAGEFRGLAKDPGLETFAERAIDIVGTGGRGGSAYNVSTVTCFICAASGIPVIKHGNRAITSSSGSADFLGQLGFGMLTEPALLRRSVEKLNFCFLFAPYFHPAFKSIMPVRKELAAEGQRTVFNILGPLLNPARPAYQLLGSFARDWAQPLADALSELGLRRGYAVHCELDPAGSLDELSTAGLNLACGVGEWRGESSRFGADAVGLPACKAGDLFGGSAEENVAELQKMLRGNGNKHLANSICLNAAAAFHVTGKADSLVGGIALAREVFQGGQTAEWLEKAQDINHDLNSVS